MVRKVTYYLDEFTDKAYSSFIEAKEMEEKSRLRFEKDEAKAYAEELAKEFGYASFSDLMRYLLNNIDMIRHIGAKARISAVYNRGISSFALDDVKSSLKPLIELALSYIANEDLTIIVCLDDKEVNTFKVKKNGFDETSVSLEGFDPVKHYLDKIQKTGNAYSYLFYSYPNKEVPKSEVVNLLDEYDIQSCEEYMDVLLDEVNSDLSNEEIYYRLDALGVDNWIGYEEAQKEARKDFPSWSCVPAGDRLTYLQNAGLWTWPVYEDVFHDTIDYDNLSTDDKYRYFIKNEDYLAEVWDKYTAFKRDLYHL